MQNRVPDYLVVGHISKDILANGDIAPGGTALYAAVTAQRLGMQTAIVTSCSRSEDYLLEAARVEGIWIHRVASPVTTTFRNSYDRWGNRSQVIDAQATSIDIEDIPPAWTDSHIVHLAPLAQELPENLANEFAHVPLLGITPQGWLRSWDGEGNVTQAVSPVPGALEKLPGNAFLVLSVEDLGNRPDKFRDYTKLAPLVAITQGSEDAFVCRDGRCGRVQALSANLADPTGAGDVFAAALFVRYLETNDLYSAARFAHAAAACSIEGRGLSAIPDRDSVYDRLSG